MNDVKIRDNDVISYKISVITKNVIIRNNE